jgi:sugar lactone lactonase YvrE
MKYTPTLLHEGYMFPETPRWSAPRGAFYFVDIDRGEIHEMKPGQKPALWFKHDDFVSGFVFGKDGELILTSAYKRKLLGVRKDSSGRPDVREIGDLSALAKYAINDMIRSARGDCYVDSVAFDFMAYASDPSVARPSPLLRVSTDGATSVATTEVNFPNGMAIAPDGKRLLVGDSLDQCIYAFELKADGSLGARSMFASLPGEMPDGISLDRDGGVWVASHHHVIRVVEGGTVTDEVDMGPTRATACMLGGADGRTLLVTASDSHDRRIIRENPSGRIFEAIVAVPGAGLPSIYN